MPRPKFKGKATKKSCRKYASKRIEHFMDEGRPQKQAVAIGLSESRKEGCGRFVGKKR